MKNPVVNPSKLGGMAKAQLREACRTANMAPSFRRKASANDMREFLGEMFEFHASNTPSQAAAEKILAQSQAARDEFEQASKMGSHKIHLPVGHEPTPEQKVFYKNWRVANGRWSASVKL